MSYLPRWFTIWMIVSYLIMIFDATFVLNRPSTISGSMSQFFSPYQLYIKIDTLYGDLNDIFVVIQSQLNLVQVAIAFIALFAAHTGVQRTRMAGALLCLIVNCFTFWKTVVYVLYDYKFLVCETGNQLQFFLVFVLPNSLWLIMPLAGIYAIGNRILNSAAEKHKND